MFSLSPVRFSNLDKNHQRKLFILHTQLLCEPTPPITNTILHKSTCTIETINLMDLMWVLLILSSKTNFHFYVLRMINPLR